MIAAVAALAWMTAAASAMDNGGETAKVAKSLDEVAAQVQVVLAKERIRDAFDLYRKMRAYGVTYQPSLTAPNYLSGQRYGAQLRMYAGIKLFDAIYAATFMNRQDVADAVATIEQAQDSLDLRSYADLNNFFLVTLKTAAARPEDVDVQLLIDQLASDYVAELPELLSSPETADYLIDSLYGFFVEMSYVTGKLMDTAAYDQMEAGFDQVAVADVYEMLLDAFEAFDRMDDEIRIGGETEQKLAVMRTMYDLIVAEKAGTIPEEDIGPSWEDPSLKIVEIRDSVLSPNDE